MSIVVRIVGFHTDDGATRRGFASSTRLPRPLARAARHR